MDVLLRIARVGHNALVNSLEVEMVDEVGEVLDADWFKFAKQSGKPNLNVLSYDLLGMIAGRHFLRRQGLLARESWQPRRVVKRAGADIAALSPAGRWPACKGSELVVETALAGHLKKVQGPLRKPGTVMITSVDFDGFVTSGGTTQDGGIALAIAGNLVGAHLRWRAYGRFPLTALPTGSRVTVADIVVRATANPGGPETYRLQAYNRDGKADPSADAGAVRWTRTKDDASPYLTGITEWQAAGLYTHTLPLEAQQQIMVNKVAVDRLSVGLAFDADEITFSKIQGIEAIEAAGTDEMKLVLTYNAPDSRVARHRSQIFSGDSFDTREGQLIQ